MKTKTKYLIAAGVVAAVAGYFIWKSRKPKNTEAIDSSDEKKGAPDGIGVPLPADPLPIGIPSKFSTGTIASGRIYTFNRMEGGSYYYIDRAASIQCIVAPCPKPEPQEVTRAEYIKAWKLKQRNSAPKPTSRPRTSPIREEAPVSATSR